MLGLKDSKTLTVEKTPITTQPSGLNSEESQARIETLLGELSLLLQADPYWGVCVSVWQLLSRKRGYYNCVEEPLANAKGVAETGIKPWRYQLARIGEKYRRLGGTLRTFDIRRTMMDIAGHAVIAVLLVSEGEDDGDRS
jgi:hypothetical protein